MESKLDWANKSRSKTGEISSNFLPAVSRQAEVKFGDNLRQRRVFSHIELSLNAIGKKIEPIVRGWHNYFSKFYPSALQPVMMWLDRSITSWLRRKYKLSWLKAYRLLHRLIARQPETFWHWQFHCNPRKAV